LGNYKISDTVFRQIIEYIAFKTDAIYKVTKVRIETVAEGICLYIETTLFYGFNVIETLREFKKKIQREIENLTAMNVKKIDIIAKGIYVPEV
jgi:uncharacterized alkaline shock family protein YloU